MQLLCTLKKLFTRNLWIHHKLLWHPAFQVSHILINLLFSYILRKPTVRYLDHFGQLYIILKWKLLVFLLLIISINLNLTEIFFKAHLKKIKIRINKLKEYIFSYWKLANLCSIVEKSPSVSTTIQYKLFLRIKNGIFIFAM